MTSEGVAMYYRRSVIATLIGDFFASYSQYYMKGLHARLRCRKWKLDEEMFVLSLSW